MTRGSLIFIDLFHPTSSCLKAPSVSSVLTMCLPETTHLWSGPRGGLGGCGSRFFSLLSPSGARSGSSHRCPTWCRSGASLRAHGAGLRRLLFDQRRRETGAGDGASGEGGVFGKRIGPFRWVRGDGETRVPKSTGVPKPPTKHTKHRMTRVSAGSTKTRLMVPLRPKILRHLCRVREA